MVMQTHIRSDKETVAKLKVLAGERSLNALLQDVAAGVEVPALTRDGITERLEKISGQITELQDNFKGLDETWFKSFMKIQKDMLLQATISGMLVSALEQLDPERFAGLKRIIQEQSKQSTDEDWQNYLHENGFYEENGEIKKIDEK